MSDSVQDIFKTSYDLLTLVKKGDDSAWNDFYNRYSPFIKAIAKDYHFRDGEDVVQDVMREISRNFSFDRERGVKFRTWLYNVTFHRIYHLKHAADYSKTDYLEDQNLPATQEEQDEFQQIWAKEERDFILKRAFFYLEKHINPKTFKAFWMLTHEGRSAREVAYYFGKDRNWADVQKSRCLAKLREYRSVLGDPDPDSEVKWDVIDPA